MLEVKIDFDRSGPTTVFRAWIDKELVASSSSLETFDRVIADVIQRATGKKVKVNIEPV